MPRPSSAMTPLTASARTTDAMSTNRTRRDGHAPARRLASAANKRTRPGQNHRRGRVEDPGQREQPPRVMPHQPRLHMSTSKARVVCQLRIVIEA
jgi:hypothetical protein